MIFFLPKSTQNRKSRLAEYLQLKFTLQWPYLRSHALNGHLRQPLVPYTLWFRKSCKPYVTGQLAEILYWDQNLWGLYDHYYRVICSPILCHGILCQAETHVKIKHKLKTYQYKTCYWNKDISYHNQLSKVFFKNITWFL